MSRGFGQFRILQSAVGIAILPAKNEYAVAVEVRADFARELFDSWRARILDDMFNSESAIEQCGI